MDTSQILSLVTAIMAFVAGGGIVRLFTVRAERNRIIGEGEYAQANAAKTIQEMSMEMLQEARVQVSEMKSDMLSNKNAMRDLNGEIDLLREKVRVLTDELDKKEQIIKEQARELASLKGN